MDVWPRIFKIYQVLMPKQISNSDDILHGRSRKHGKILLIRFKSIGDILFTLPAVHVMHDRFWTDPRL